MSFNLNHAVVVALVKTNFATQDIIQACTVNFNFVEIRQVPVGTLSPALFNIIPIEILATILSLHLFRLFLFHFRIIHTQIPALLSIFTLVRNHDIIGLYACYAI